MSCITILKLKDYPLHVFSEYFARPFLPLGVVQNTAICNYRIIYIVLIVVSVGDPRWQKWLFYFT